MKGPGREGNIPEIKDILETRVDEVSCFFTLVNLSSVVGLVLNYCFDQVKLFFNFYFYFLRFFHLSISS